MSVSSHLNPEPERRLWIIHENLRRTLEWTDMKLGALAVFSVLELIMCGVGLPPATFVNVVAALLCAVLPLCVFAVTPLIEIPPRMPLADPERGKPRQGDSLLIPADITKYPQVELVNILDRYLGGGVTATPYYDDIVGQIVIISRLSSRKARVFAAAGAIALAAQLLLLGRLALYLLLRN